MIKSRSSFARSLSVLAVVCAMAAVSAPPAAAQTAANLKCNGCVNSKDIENKSIRTNDIRNNAVNGAKIANNAVTSAKIANNAVNGAKVLNGSLTAQDMRNEAGADFVEGPDLFDLTGGHDLVSTIRLSAPTAGTVIANASGIFGPAISGIVQCSITTGNVTTSPGSIVLWPNIQGDLDLAAVPFAGTRGFQVGAGTTDINLVCRDASGNTNVLDVILTAMFFPTRY